MTAQLGDLVSIVGGGTPSRDRPEYYNGDIPWVTVKDLKDELTLSSSRERITKLGLENSASRLVPAGSVIIATRMAVGKAVRNLVEVAINQDLKALLCSPQIDSQFLLFFLQSKAQELEALANGSTVKGVLIEDLQELEVDLPQLHQQKRMAKLLEQADRLRRTRRYTLKLSDTFLPAAFLELFGDLRLNPHGFQIRELGEICDVRDGTHDSPKFHLQGVPLVTSKNLVNGFVDLSEVDLISEEDFAKINKRSKVDCGDILMPMIGTIGNPILVDHEPRYAIKNVALVKFIEGSPSAIYLRELLRGAYFDFLISKISRGGTQQFIALGDIRSFCVPIPPLPLQQKFASLVKRQERLRAGQREALRQAEHLFQSLLHRAFAT